MKRVSVLFLAVCCIVVVGCGSDNKKDMANNGEPIQTETQNATANFETLNGNSDYLIIAKGKDEGIAAVKSSAKKDTDGVYAIDIFAFLTKNNESISQDIWYFRKDGNLLQFATHQKSFGQKWQTVETSDFVRRNAFDIASLSAKEQKESVIYTPDKEPKKQTKIVADNNTKKSTKPKVEQKEKTWESFPLNREIEPDPAKAAKYGQFRYIVFECVYCKKERIQVGAYDCYPVGECMPEVYRKIPCSAAKRLDANSGYHLFNHEVYSTVWVNFDGKKWGRY